MSDEDVRRYLSFEAPSMGVVANRPAAVVCFRGPCDEVVSVDPQTIVPEDDDAVDVEAREPDSHNTYQVEIYCSAGCRNAAYTEGDMAADGGEKVLEIPESDLFEVYSLLADATETHAAGDPNGCAEAAAEAKQRILDIHDQYGGAE